MLGKDNRLSKDNDFDKVFKFGKSAYVDMLGVKALKNNLEHSRFGIMVSTKISKKAVERNKIKRLIREGIKSKMSVLEDNYDVVVITLPPVLKQKILDIEQALANCFARIKSKS